MSATWWFTNRTNLARVRPFVKFLACVSILATQGACEQSRSHPLEGDWDVRITTLSTNLDGGDLERETIGGIFVFSRALPCYCELGALPEDGVLGRSYLHLDEQGRPVSGAAAVLASGEEWRFEVVGIIGTQDSVIIFPTSEAAGPSFRGVLNGASVRGSWASVFRGDTSATGTFLMTRRSSREFTDSAIVRTERYSRLPSPQSASAPEEGVDTARAVDSP